MDQSYVQKMQQLGLNGREDTSGRYGRITKQEPDTTSSTTTTGQYQKRVGAIESFTGETAAPQKPVEYKMYERNNIIASSKFATPKQIETIASQKHEENDVYVQCVKPQVVNPSSPTHSLSGSSQNSGSPRQSVATGQVTSPVYENVEYYGGRSNVYSPYYHSINQPEYKKAQPQVPTCNRYINNSNEIESLPVYENVHDFTTKSTGATPGPQVASGQAPPPYPNPNYTPNQTNYVMNQPNYAGGQVNYAVANQPVYSVMHPPRINATNNPKTSPQTPPYYHKSPTKSLTQQQIDEINSSDYVCMTGNISQTLSTNTHFQTSTAKNYERAPATGIAGPPTKPSKDPPISPETVQQPPKSSPSPTPSTMSNASSGKLKFSGKSLLPYCVTPPRPRGPTEAERKIEEMTRQIEEEMEKHEEEGEYFGMPIAIYRIHRYGLI